MKLEEQLRAKLLGEGAAWVGIADLTVLPAGPRHDLPRGISIVIALDPRIVQDIANGPTLTYYDEYCDVNARLNILAESAVAFLKRQGHWARAIPATMAVLDPKTLWTALPHKTVATLAGLGWVGKCALLVSEQFGSAFRMASVLTDADLPAGQPIRESRCGDCTACLDICPAHAPTGRLWHPGINRAEFFDAFACHKSASEQSAALGIQHTICGRCIAACPWTKKHLGGGGKAR